MNTTGCNTTRQRILDSALTIVGHKGFSAVGLNEVLNAAHVPKGSFYHYFDSKDVFGKALLERYFELYHSDMDAIFRDPGLSGRERLLRYWEYWAANQTGTTDCRKCLAVKLGAEVADLSELMRLELERGTSVTIARLTLAIEEAVEDRSVSIREPAASVAYRLYELWLGASVMVKITRTAMPFDQAMLETRRVFAEG
ncbi:TetR/AcrR family transcriptional regulator [Pseudomonas sp. KFB-139]|uniref:TetR/AcrR family transcriptional regulator n=1 Tax=Pseudomonas serbiensis TaxID=3064350 RepID=A0ABT9CTS3_9PSED|nr:TetR/AcrR family transcriptional regulator [Pseudomonas sp. KFB-138]MDO7928127.1 TetR/AcrR family transcriptional regulator [Pseudomonas sp. KFB-138]